MKVLILGATGLVGGEVLRLALADSRVESAIAPTRRNLTMHPKLAILEASRYLRAASTTIRASVTASAIADRTLGLLFCNSCDSTLANFTAAIRLATTANVPLGFSIVGITIIWHDW
jgi:uncharacterized protein YbjT (DUF2867 family)